MTIERIRYSEGYKYVLEDDYGTQVDIQPADFVRTDFINKGYAWDGASGPTVDTPDSMRGSLIHDALYQLLRLGKLPAEDREAADKELLKACLADGMLPIRAHVWYGAVRQFGDDSAERAYPVFSAP